MARPKTKGSTALLSPDITRLIKALGELPAEAQKALDESLATVAGRVVSDARRRVPYVTGDARASYQVNGAGISFGGPRAPYVPWLEFGGKRGRKTTVSRLRVRGGRYVYPAIADNAKETERLVIEALTGIVITYGLDVS